MYKTHVRYIYINIDTCRHHNSLPDTSLGLQWTLHITSQLEQYFILHLNPMDIFWHILDDDEWMMDVGMKILNTTLKDEKTPLIKLPSEILPDYLRMPQIPTVHNTCV